nr:putative peptidoglycan glycosyltransferase FtsW [Atopobium fossor]
MAASTRGTSQQPKRTTANKRSSAKASGRSTARIDAASKRTNNKKPFLERITAGVPARFMEPRLILSLITAALVVFGLVMIYSASSVKALQTTGDAAYFFKRQLVYALVGGGVAILLGISNYHTLRKGLRLAWVASLLVLLLTAGLGAATKGAVRWLTIAGFSFQPSEFVKVVLVLYAADILHRYYAEHSIGLTTFAIEAGLRIAAPLLLILIQPDKGTTLILGGTILVMAYLSGLSMRFLVPAVGIAVAFIVVLILADDYSRARVITMFNPEADPYGAGYQLLQGFYAFGSGSFMGAGIGMSRQKYAYLPEAHNDFIFAVVGEETGLIGTIGVILGFCAFLYYGYRIAKNAPDLCGKLIAAGCTSLIIIQLFVNVMGILGIAPMTGKPLPFLSYGGSSIMSTLALVGLIISVSKQSVLPETEFDRRRSQMSLASTPEQNLSTAESSADKPQKAGVFTFHTTAERMGITRTQSGHRSNNQRIDLGPSPTERLRSRRSDSSKDNRRR